MSKVKTYSAYQKSMSSRQSISKSFSLLKSLPEFDMYESRIFISCDDRSTRAHSIDQKVVAFWYLKKIDHIYLMQKIVSNFME